VAALIKDNITVLERGYPEGIKDRIFLLRTKKQQRYHLLLGIFFSPATSGKDIEGLTCKEINYQIVIMGAFSYPNMDRSSNTEMPTSTILPYLARFFGYKYGCTILLVRIRFFF